MPVISITGAFGAKPAARVAAFSEFGHRLRGRFADLAAALADQEHHEIVGCVPMHAGDEGIAAFDAMRESVLDQEIERAIDRDRRMPRTVPARRGR